MDLIRELLLKLEALPIPSTGFRMIEPGEPDVQIKGYPIEEIHYHISLLEQADLIHSGGVDFGRQMPSGTAFRSLTWAGHDFLDSIRSPEVWSKTKAGALAAGGFTMALLADLAKGLIRKQIEERTGVKL